MVQERRTASAAAVADREVAGSASSWTHQATFEWLTRSPGFLDGHEGEWVAMDGPRIVGHSPSLEETVRQSHEAGVDDPLLVPVPPPGDLVV